MSPTLTTFLFELANFLLLAALVGWLFFKPVRRALDARQRAERERIEALAAREAAITNTTSELEARRRSFDEETSRLRSERLAAAESEAASIVDRATRDAARQRELGEKMKTAIERAQAERLSTAAAAAARAAVSRLLTQLRSPDLDRALGDLACRQLEEPVALGQVLVESAAPLEATSQAAIAKAAGDRASALEFRVVPELGAGLRITTASGMIDASAAGLAAYSERALRERLSAPEPTAKA